MLYTQCRKRYIVRHLYTRKGTLSYQEIIDEFNKKYNVAYSKNTDPAPHINMSSTKYPIVTLGFPRPNEQERIRACSNQIFVNWRYSDSPTPNSSIDDEKGFYRDTTQYSIYGKFVDYDFASVLLSTRSLRACIFYQGFTPPIVSAFVDITVEFDGDSILAIIAGNIPRLFFTPLPGRILETDCGWIWMTFALAVIPVRMDAPAQTIVWNEPEGLEEYFFQIAEKYGIPKK